MLEYVDTLQLKKKFGHLLSRLHMDAHLPLSNISDILIKSPLLDLLEENKVNNFLRMSYEEMLSMLYKTNFNGEDEISTELYWAGIQYINIFLNLRIPLKQIILLLPLTELLGKFDVFHEMNDIELVKHYKSCCLEKSILRPLRQARNYTVKELSYLTDISEPSLKSYEGSNTKLFSASYKNIHNISKILNLSDSLFYGKSLFVPYDRNLWSDEVFVTSFKENLEIRETAEIITGYPSKKEVQGRINEIQNRKNSLKSTVIVINDVITVFEKKEKSIRNRVIKPQIAEKSISLAIDKALSQNIEGLYF